MPDAQLPNLIYVNVTEGDFLRPDEIHNVISELTQEYDLPPQDVSDAVLADLGWHRYVPLDSALSTQHDGGDDG